MDGWMCFDWAACAYMAFILVHLSRCTCLLGSEFLCVFVLRKRKCGKSTANSIQAFIKACRGTKGRFKHLKSVFAEKKVCGFLLVLCVLVNF